MLAESTLSTESMVEDRERPENIVNDDGGAIRVRYVADVSEIESSMMKVIFSCVSSIRNVVMEAQSRKIKAYTPPMQLTRPLYALRSSKHRKAGGWSPFGRPFRQCLLWAIKEHCRAPRANQYDPQRPLRDLKHKTHRVTALMEARRGKKLPQSC
jgi:hypothetical protein